MAILGACGSEGTSAPAELDSDTVIGDDGKADQALAALFDANTLLRAGTEQRAPFALFDLEGIPVDDVPGTLAFDVLLDDTPIGPSITVARRIAEIPRPYYPLVFTPPQPGLYTIRTNIESGEIETEITVKDKDEAGVPAAGAEMVKFDTPTTEDSHGVVPICTADPQCPLHGITLTQALETKKPVAFLISTPKFCQIGICGPVLDILISRREKYPEVRMVHAEVFEDGEAPQPEVPAPVLAAFNLTYEPVLFLVQSDGIIAKRLDNIFDATELEEGLDAISGT